MKKTLSLISAAVMTAGMAISTIASADSTLDPPLTVIEVELPDYKPNFYFKAEAGTGIEVLKNGTVYVNTNVASKDGVIIPCAVFIKDDQKLAGTVIAKMECENKSLALKNLSSPESVEKYGKKAYTSNEVIFKQFDDLNILSVVYYSSMSFDPMELTGETSDAYPIACFNAILEKNATFGNYDINIIYRDEFISEVNPKYKDENEDDQTTIKIYRSVDMSKTSKNLRVNVSDRQLGDVNNNNFIDAVDASAILKEYATLSAKKDSTMTKEQAATSDINGDKIIDAVDASGVLAFYASVSSGMKDLTLNQFINKE